MTMKKKLLTTLSVVLILGLAALGILAYLTDTDSDVNVMTLGNVQIDQIEQEWNANGTALQDFTQAKPLYPYVGTLGWNNENVDGGAYRTFTMNNVVDKYVSVKNTGKSDAYVRTVFAFEMGEYESIDDFYYKVIGTSTNAVDGNEFDFLGTWDWGTKYVAQIDGKNYMIWEAVHKDILKPGETTIPSLLQVYMTPACGNEEVKKVDGNGNGTYDILVLSQAVQTEGFANAEDALTAGFGAANAANVQKWFGGMKIPGVVNVETAAEAQAALDNAVPGTIIKLAPGVDYGTLYMRPSKGNAATKEVDWIGNNYSYETYSCFEDITIVGTQGATVDAIEIEGGTYYHTSHSQASTYPVMLSLIELKNVTIDGVTFTGEGGNDPQGHGNAINLTGHIKVNGLTLKNCTLENDANNARLIYKTEATTTEHKYAYDGETYTFVPDLKDIVVSGCTFNGGYMGLELRETENLTIVNNTFKGVASRDMLLPTNSGCTYSGTIEISNNKSIGAKERFIRGSGIGNATLIIKNNTVTDYQGADDDYIKVDGATGIIEVSGNTATAADASRTLTIKY